MEGAVTNQDRFRPGQQLRPLGVGGILDAAIKLYTNNALALWKTVAVLIVPVGLISYTVIYASLPSGAFVHNGTLYVLVGTRTSAAGVTTEIVLSVLAALVVQGALALSLVDAYIGHPIDWVQSLREAADRIGSLLWVAIIFSVGVTLGFAALVLPGIWLMVVWSVAVPALMFEHVGGFKALGRSFELVRGRWWPTFGALVVAVITLFVVLFMVGLIFHAIESGVGVNSVGLWLGLSWLSVVIGDLIAFPFIAAVIAVMYIDLRVRKEALDLELLAGTLVQRSRNPLALWRRLDAPGRIRRPSEYAQYEEGRRIHPVTPSHSPDHQGSFGTLH